MPAIILQSFAYLVWAIMLQHTSWGLSFSRIAHYSYYCLRSFPLHESEKAANNLPAFTPLFYIVFCAHELLLLTLIELSVLYHYHVVKMM